MKKAFLAALLACLFLFSGCQKAPAQESEVPTPTPTPTQSQTAETPPVSPDPETSTDPGSQTPDFSAFLENFAFDQIEVDRTPDEDGEGYQDHDVYLLDSNQMLSFRDLLRPDTWTVATGDELAIMYSEALRARDTKGNHFNIARWDEEKCLVNYFFVYLMDRNLRIDKVVRFWAPASVLDDALTFVDGLTPLGTIDNTAARYFNLFKQDWGFDMLIRDATESGNISDDQMAAYVFYVQSQEGRVYFDTGVSPSAVDEITQKYFGRKMSNYDTAWSNVLPSGAMVPSGWDFHAACYPVLTGTPDVDEYGNITATFKVYTVWDDFWDEDLPRAKLAHIQEYLLAGNDSDYLANPNVYLSTISITFRIETEQDSNGVWKGYLFYDSVRVVG